ncbi:YHS domain-containing (seleno)protein [Reinekea marina]|uniref:YHS domain-containing (Seleno)protein n=2 Tax=Reinekea marina TaxID=1310421 RepID=A0ABV7WT93_9GAMM
MKTLKLKTLFLLGYIGFSTAFAADAIYTPWHNNLAIKGYDSVAYFTLNKAIKGDTSHSFEWQGANWLFSSAENKALFVASPETYAPQYGGYCAYAVAKNSVAGVDPTQFTIHEGKLYLNYSQKIQSQWLQQKEAFIAEADKNWPNVLE